MTSLVFFGAGASKPFGIPTMQDMVVEFENRLKDEDKKCFEFYYKIKEIIVEEYGKSHVDIESIFSVLDGIISQTKAKDLGYYAFYHIKSINNSHPEGRPIDEHIERANKTENLLFQITRLVFVSLVQSNEPCNLQNECIPNTLGENTSLFEFGSFSK